jgi:hypothetical protein
MSMPPIPLRAEQLDEIDKGLHEGRAYSLLHPCNCLAFHPQKEP